jgi:hypothetical protein
MFYTLPANLGEEIDGYRPIVVAARVRDLPALLNNQSAVLALATAVRDLYDKMDHTLRFPAEIPRAAAASP